MKWTSFEFFEVELENIVTSIRGQFWAQKILWQMEYKRREREIEISANVQQSIRLELD